MAQEGSSGTNSGSDIDSNENTDVFLYNGSIERGADLDFINCVHKHKENDDCTVVMVSGGGSPDAAYKMARYLQANYNGYRVIVSGFCKSAATLFAIGAKEIVFCPYGELGPLDIQLQKDDNLTGHESGLNIKEAFSTLEGQARDTFTQHLIDIMRVSSGAITFKTASKSAVGLVSALYAPIFSQIEPEEVGSRSRSMRIGEDYAMRLDCGNIKVGGIRHIATRYSSHSFVIDMDEASMIFENIRRTSEKEQKLIDSLGKDARFPNDKIKIKKLDMDEKVINNATQIEDIENEKPKPPRKNTENKKRSSNGRAVKKGT